jgi:hypothetical protein
MSGLVSVASATGRHCAEQHSSIVSRNLEGGKALICQTPLFYNEVAMTEPMAVKITCVYYAPTVGDDRGSCAGTQIRFSFQALVT